VFDVRANTVYGRRFLQVKRHNQQYQSTEGTNSTQTNQTYNKQTQDTASSLFYNNMRWLGYGSHRGQGCQTWTVVGQSPRYPPLPRVQIRTVITITIVQWIITITANAENKLC